MKGLVAVPVHNEADSLPHVIEALRKHFPDDRLLFVDDGSDDSSPGILLGSRVKTVTHLHNAGYCAGLCTALSYALMKDYDYVVFFDGDGQHCVEDLLRVIAAREEHGYDLVIGSRYLLGYVSCGRLRLAVTRAFSCIASWFMDGHVTDVTSGMKLIARPFMRASIDMPTEDMHAELVVGLARCGARVHEEAITVLPRKEGVSMYHFRKACLYPIKTVLCLIRTLWFVRRLRRGD